VIVWKCTRLLSFQWR